MRLPAGEPRIKPPERGCDAMPAMAVLKLVPPAGPFASLDVLRGIIQQLAVRRGRQVAMLGVVDSVADALRNGRPNRARNELLALRRAVKDLSVTQQIDVIVKQLS